MDLRRRALNRVCPAIDPFPESRTLIECWYSNAGIMRKQLQSSHAWYREPLVMPLYHVSSSAVFAAALAVAFFIFFLHLLRSLPWSSGGGVVPVRWRGGDGGSEGGAAA